MNNLLVGKTILITGASSGIGKASAIFFSEQGAKLVISGRSEARLKETFNSLVNKKEHYFFNADLTCESSTAELFRFCSESIGLLDGVLHCAGIQKTLPLKASKRKHYQEIMDANFFSAFNLIKSFQKKGVYNPKGASCVLLSSVASRGEPGNSLYAASKGALESFVKSIAVELSRKSIRINVISPGFVKTEMTEKATVLLTDEQYIELENKHELGFGEANDIASAAAFALSDYSKWATGSNFVIDGGYLLNS